jgi:hypothetical protein
MAPASPAAQPAAPHDPAAAAAAAAVDVLADLACEQQAWRDQHSSSSSSAIKAASLTAAAAAGDDGAGGLTQLQEQLSEDTQIHSHTDKQQQGQSPDHLQQQQQHWQVAQLAVESGWLHRSSGGGAASAADAHSAQLLEGVDSATAAAVEAMSMLKGRAFTPLQTAGSAEAVPVNQKRVRPADESTMTGGEDAGPSSQQIAQALAAAAQLAAAASAASDLPSAAAAADLIEPLIPPHPQQVAAEAVGDCVGFSQLNWQRAGGLGAGASGVQQQHMMSVLAAIAPNQQQRAVAAARPSPAAAAAAAGGVAAAGPPAKRQRLSGVQMSELIASVKHHVLVNPERYTHCVIKDMKEKYPELELNMGQVRDSNAAGHKQAAGCPLECSTMLADWLQGTALIARWCHDEGCGCCGAAGCCPTTCTAQ